MAPTRREFLGLLSGAGFAAALGSCTKEAKAPRVAHVEVPLAQVPVGARHVVLFNGTPVEVHRRADGVEAFSLICTHMGCTVAWREPEKAFVCPCHGGRFDAEGKPLRGPALRPLSRVPARIEGERIVLG